MNNLKFNQNLHQRMAEVIADISSTPRVGLEPIPIHVQEQFLNRAYENAITNENYIYAIENGEDPQNWDDELIYDFLQEFLVYFSQK